MQSVFVISSTGLRLMPTNPIRARKLLKSGKAEIHKHKPFTIRLLERRDGDVQPVEYKCDTGYQHIGISICSSVKEYINEQRDLLKDETERHNDCRKYRRTRRNRLRYRKPRWNNRKRFITKDGFTPSIRNKRDVHIALFKMYNEVIPITSAVFEMGQFDTQVLKAIAEGNPIPQGADYQHGEQYGIATLREAIFTRDNYKCQICRRSFKENAILQVHHIGFWKNDRTNRPSNLLTICEKCHTSKNHKKGGKLYGLKSTTKSFKEATFMTMVRFDMFNKLKEATPDVKFHMTYGARTKLQRKSFNIKKSHSNDAYCMGNFHPKYRTDFQFYKKCRRNNRILSKFYDAKYIDNRDSSKKSGSQLSCNRTKRNIQRNNTQNLRMFHGKKISKGRCSIRQRHYSLRPGDMIMYMNQWHTVKGVQNNGTYVAIVNFKPVNVLKITKTIHAGGWLTVNSAHPTV